MAKYKFVERRTIEETYIVDIPDEDIKEYMENGEWACEDKDDAALQYCYNNVLGDDKYIVNEKTLDFPEPEQWIEEMQ